MYRMIPDAFFFNETFFNDLSLSLSLTLPLFLSRLVEAEETLESAPQPKFTRGKTRRGEPRNLIFRSTSPGFFSCALPRSGEISVRTLLPGRPGWLSWIRDDFSTVENTLARIEMIRAFTKTLSIGNVHNRRSWWALVRKSTLYRTSAPESVSKNGFR